MTVIIILNYAVEQIDFCISVHSCILTIYLSEISYQDCGERFINEDDLSRKSRIIGGHEAAVNSWPWLVNFVSYKNKSFQVCSGNLIDPQWILTTAHCFVSNNFQFPVDKWTYIAGDHYLNKIDPHEQVFIYLNCISYDGRDKWGTLIVYNNLLLFIIIYSIVA